MLNAFRHHSGSHLASVSLPAVVSGCSTPFGITAVLTQYFAGDGSGGSTCSTPFGITAVLTVD